MIHIIGIARKRVAPLYRGNGIAHCFDRFTEFDPLFIVKSLKDRAGQQCSDWPG